MSDDTNTRFAAYHASTSPFENRPCAATGLISYRCRGRYGWIMIGARNHEDAMVQALRSCEVARRDDLEVWNGTAYVPAL